MQHNLQNKEEHWQCLRENQEINQEASVETFRSVACPLEIIVWQRTLKKLMYTILKNVHYDVNQEL